MENLKENGEGARPSFLKRLGEVALMATGIAAIGAAIGVALNEQILAETANLVDLGGTNVAASAGAGLALAGAGVYTVYDRLKQNSNQEQSRVQVK